jgi:hypothetical protein
MPEIGPTGHLGNRSVTPALSCQENFQSSAKANRTKIEQCIATVGSFKVHEQSDGIINRYTLGFPSCDSADRISIERSLRLFP